MRSIQVYRALDQVANRFTLCQTISQTVRLMHKSGNSMESSVTSALVGVGERGFSAVIKGIPLPLLHEGPTAVMFCAADVA